MHSMNNIHEKIKLKNKFQVDLMYNFSIIFNLIYEELKINNNEYWKYILYKLEEAQTCFSHERFFSIKEIIPVLKNINISNNGITKIIKEIDKDSTEYHFKIIEIYEDENEIISSKVMKKIIEHNDLFEELVNYIFAEEKFEEELISVKDYTADYLADKAVLTVIEAYPYLIKLREDPEITENLIEDMINFPNLPF